MLTQAFLFGFINGLVLLYQQILNNRMTNIKISIRDVDSGPLLIQKNQMSETEHRKKNSLYQKPQKDKIPQKKQRSANTTNKNSRDDKGLRQTGLRSSGEDEGYRQAEKKLIEDLDKMGKNQASLDMIHNSNNILQKQNQILQENQRTLYQMAKNNNTKPQQVQQNKQYDNVLVQIKREVDQMRKIKEEIERSSKQFIRTAGEANKGSKQPAVPSNISEMNSNLKHLAQLSKNQLEGLQDLEAIKHLQNFNMEGYQQAINNLKRQIVQYQKESEQIERQLKLRAAKLEKLQITPNFDEKLLQPYETYLKKKAQNVDLHAIKERIYDKLGYFDYGKFEYDTSQIMADVKNEINDFYIVCKQYKIQVPDIKIDQKQLKGLDLKLPSAIDEFKAERGIDFSKPSPNIDKNRTDTLSDSRTRKERRKGEPVVSLKNNKQGKSHKQPQAIRELNSKPLDFATQVKFNKTNEPNQKTILQSQKQKQRKQVESNMRKMRKPKEDEDFEKYLEYRAREELELIYKQKKERLQKKQNDLLDYCREDQGEIYLNLDLRNDVRRSVSKEKKREESPKKMQEEKRQEIKEQEDIPKLKPIPGSGGQTIKEVGTEVLKEKLKNLLGGNNINRRPHHEIAQPVQPSMPQAQQPETKLENVAQNFLSMINNTLTQVNGQLSKTIQTKYEQRSLSRDKNQSYRRSPAKIQIPKLEQFRPPPQFNMPVYNPVQHQNYQYVAPAPAPVPVYVERPKAEQPKIVPKNYEHLRIKQDEAIADLQISQDSYAADFE